MVRTFAELEEGKAENLRRQYPQIAPVSYGYRRIYHVCNVKRNHKNRETESTNLFLINQDLKGINPRSLKYIESKEQKQLNLEKQALLYIEQQAKLFDQVKHELLDKYEGKYILFEDGKVLDSGESREEVAMRAYEEYGMKPLFIEQVLEEDFTPEIWTPLSFFNL